MRKVTQLSECVDGWSALCDDGTIWVLSASQPTSVWRQLAPIPQPEPPEPPEPAEPAKPAKPAKPAAALATDAMVWAALDAWEAHSHRNLDVRMRAALEAALAARGV